METPRSLATPDCSADNQACQLAQFLYGTLGNIEQMTWKANLKKLIY